MKKVIIFGGTTEGRKLAESLSDALVAVVYVVATDYGKQPIKESEFIQVKIGRMNADDMLLLFRQVSPDAVVDATHPFAKLVKEEIDTALFKYDMVPFFRVNRPDVEIDYTNCTFFDNASDCAKALKETSGNIFLTTGSKDLAEFAKDDAVRDRLIVRVIPSEESLRICMDNGINGKQIIAMQGPFSAGMNLAFLREYNAKVLVLKESGSFSGEAERIIAANQVGAKSFIIRRPDSNLKGDSLYQVKKDLFELLDVREVLKMADERGGNFEVNLAAFGMGLDSMTSEVEEAILEADYIFGAPRMIVSIESDAKKFPFYKPNDILSKLKELSLEEKGKNKKATVLFSGDTGFYSGAAAVKKVLDDDGSFKVKALPGVSSVSAFFARIGKPWQDANILSTHGKSEDLWVPELVESVLYNEKSFALTSGRADVRRIGELLLELEDKHKCKFKIIAGVNLYSDEKLINLNARSCSNFNEEGLCVLYVENPNRIKKILSPFLKDSSFLRDNVPMSKEEIRALSICKLKISAGAVCYDIGSGSGSVAVELGMLDSTLRVYAIELREEAFKLTQENIDKFALKNVFAIWDTAPEAFDNLPLPTHVFIGGSGGRLDEIISKLISLNTEINVVINTVTLETITEVNQVLKKYNIAADVIQVALSKAKHVGDYNIMQGQNPVYIVSFTLNPTS